MTRRFRALLFGILLTVPSGPAFAQTLPRTSPESVGMSSERLERLSGLLRQYTAEQRLPGAVALVARDGEIAYLEAFGTRDLTSADPMSTDDIFRIASQSKAIASVAVMILVEEGSLLLSDPISKHLPEFRQIRVAVAREQGGAEIVPANRPITVRHLLTHTSGLNYGSGIVADEWAAAGIQGWYFADREEPIRETVRRMASLPLAAQPGEAWVYGYSTDVLGALVEVVSGQPLDRFLAERIFEPLGMSDTHFYLPAAKRDRLATVYSAGEDGLERTADCCGMISQGAYADGPAQSFSGGAGLLSTASDYARFLQMLLNGGELSGRRILSRKTVELMTTDHLGTIDFREGEGFGLGFSVVEHLGARGAHGSVGEYGWGGAYHSTYWVDPAEDLVVVYLTQLIPAGSIDDHGKLRALVYQAIVD